MITALACRHGVALALCVFAALATAQTRPPPDREQLERKLASTSTLIESSSGARQIKASGEPRAEEQRRRARDLHRRAGDALKAGDLEGTAKLLDAAALAMFDGVRLSSPEQVTLPKQRADFDARMESTRVLLEAQKRIAVEKNAGSRAGELTRGVESILANAAALAANGRLGEARQAVDQAYLAVKAAVGGMREGETVVRSLTFATKAEEYHYEIDRNDTHRMLTQILLKDKRGAGTVDAMVEQALAAAAKLRAQAEQEAARRDHDTAVKTLEESTRELVKAIRGAGVYIPG